MKALGLVLLFSAATLWATPLTLSVGNSIETDGISHHLEEIETPLELFDGTWDDPLDPIPIPEDFDLPLPQPGPIGGGNETLVIIDQIINLGEKVWNFIEKSKPTLNITRAYANALPKGVKTSEELEGFTPLNYRSFRMYGKNGFGSTVYDVTYTLVHRYGGRYENQGAYVEHATVLPHKVSALWGYTVDAGVSNVGAVNVGTREKPVGSVVMECFFRASTILKVSEFRTVYEFRGDSSRVTSINNDKDDTPGEAPSVQVHEVD